MHFVKVCLVMKDENIWNFGKEFNPYMLWAQNLPQGVALQYLSRIVYNWVKKEMW